MILRWRWVAIAVSAAFFAGVVAGAEGTRRWIRYDHLKAQLAAKDAQLERLKRASKVNEAITAEHTKAEMNNEEVEQVLADKARNSPGDTYECVDADGLQLLQRLR